MKKMSSVLASLAMTAGMIVGLPMLAADLGLWHGGQNISNAAAAPRLAASPPRHSGFNLGDMLPPFHPHHVAGPDRGRSTCPV